MMTYSDIAQVERISRVSFFERGVDAIIDADVPLLIDWCDPIPEEEIVSRISKGLGDTPVALLRKLADPATASSSDVTKIRIAEFFEDPGYRTSKDGYVHRVVTNIKKNEPLIESLLGDAQTAVFDYSGSWDYVYLWINHCGQFGRAHFDALENFGLQLAGVKRFILAPPNRANYYVRPMFKGLGHQSGFPNMLEVDIAKYPCFASEIPKLRQAVVKPGQMLYIPIGWWHQVEPLGALNIKMNFWLFDRKLFQRPYVFADACYKEYFRKYLKRYDYQQEIPVAAQTPA